MKEKTMYILSSTFSLMMLDIQIGESVQLTLQRITKSQFLGYMPLISKNCVNPNHKSTATLVSQVCPIPCEGGTIDLTQQDTMIVIMPPRSMANREAREIDLSCLEQCQFWLIKG